VLTHGASSSMAGGGWPSAPPVDLSHCLIPTQCGQMLGKKSKTLTSHCCSQIAIPIRCTTNTRTPLHLHYTAKVPTMQRQSVRRTLHHTLLWFKTYDVRRAYPETESQSGAQRCMLGSPVPRSVVRNLLC